MSTSPHPRRADAERNRADILQAAAAVLADDPTASIGAIARAAGLTRRAVYGHFDDRDALLSAVIAQGAQRFNVIAEDVTDTDPRQALAHLATALWHEAAHVHAAAALALNDSLVTQTAAALAPVRARLLDICARGHATGALRRDVSPATTARLVEETVRGVITRMDAAAVRDGELPARAVLSVAGLGWTEVDALLRADAAGHAGPAGGPDGSDGPPEAAERTDDTAVGSRA